MKIADFDKNTDPSLTIIFISSLIMKSLDENEIIPYSDLKDYVVSNTSEKADYVIPYALSFLYTINKIEYIVELDSFRMVRL
jgi:hypothetical protein